MKLRFDKIITKHDKDIYNKGYQKAKEDVLKMIRREYSNERSDYGQGNDDALDKIEQRLTKGEEKEK